jgi:hypothetical protein
MGKLEQAPAFGHTDDAAEGIEGLEVSRQLFLQVDCLGLTLCFFQLLEEHFAQARRDQDLDSNASVDEEADAAGWNDWEVESESGSDSDGGWEQVSSDSDHDIDMSDSDDDDEEKAKRKARKGKGKADDADSVKDIDMDAKSEGGATDISEGKKLSLLATQKVRDGGHSGGAILMVLIRFSHRPTLLSSLTSVSKQLRQQLRMAAVAQPSASSLILKRTRRQRAPTSVSRMKHSSTSGISWARGRRPSRTMKSVWLRLQRVVRVVRSMEPRRISVIRKLVRPTGRRQGTSLS